MLQALMKLFAILASINRESSSILSRNFVESFLKTQFSKKLVDQSLLIFDKNLEELKVFNNPSKSKRITSFSVRILYICDQINKELHIRNKFLILFSLIQFSKYFEANTTTDEDFRHTIADTVRTIADGLLISQEEYENCRAFIVDKFYKVPVRNALLVVSNDKNFSFTEINHLQKDFFNGTLFILKIRQADIYIFYYTGTGHLSLGGKQIYPNHIYQFPKGSTLKSDHFTPVYYSDIVSGFLRKTDVQTISLQVRDLTHIYPNSENGIRPLSFSAQSGNLVAIMGGSGTGKSTLMRLLSGTLQPDSGDMLINGYSFYRNRSQLEGMIGYVPQDDLLIEELTVYENLYYSARLCLGEMQDAEVKERVDGTLQDLDLDYIRDLKVGSPFNKFISGGQRKRLNIALELIREPSILLADEPTSGLSSTDSENVMQLLKEQALLGKIVVVNIHQPSSELFKLFDSIIILDKGGYLVYSGNPLDAFSYLKDIARRVDAEEIECGTCGNVQTDELLKIVESRQVNEFGVYTHDRLIQPEEWYRLIREKNGKTEQEEKGSIPEHNLRPPSYWKQFFTYSLRNILTKIADRQYLLFALTVAPILALVLGFFTKYVSGTADNEFAYIFSQNENIPAYLLMSVIVVLFVGLIVSAEEIIGDRKILAREAFLRLSRTAYLNSKIFFLFALSAVQVLTFVLIGNGILKIQGLNVDYWLILFSTAAFAVLLGLNISSAFNSVIAIYINIPFILVPLILFSGVIVKFDKLHYKVSSNENVPVVADIMASRWAYEALVVTQFSRNAYEKHFYENDREEANTLFLLDFLIPELNNTINDYRMIQDKPDAAEKKERYTERTFNALRSLGGFPDNALPAHEDGSLDPDRLSRILALWKRDLAAQADYLNYRKDSLLEAMLVGGMNKEQLISLKENFDNESINDLVLNENELRKIVIRKNKIIRKDTPVFQDPVLSNGRAQFYAGIKRLGRLEIPTIWFNIGVIWLMTCVLYLFLVFDLARKLIEATPDTLKRKQERTKAME